MWGNAEVLENAHVTSGLVVEQAVIRGDAEIKKGPKNTQIASNFGKPLIYGTVGWQMYPYPARVS